MSRLTQYSHSRLKKFEECPRRYYCEITKENYKAPPDPEAFAIGRAAHELLELACLGRATADKYPIAQEMIEDFHSTGGDIRVEESLAFTKEWKVTDWFRGPSLWLRAKMDLMVVDEDAVFIVDWKTGKIRVDEDQLALYALVAHKLYPDRPTILTSYIWLDHECKATTSVFHPQHMPEIEAKLRKRCDAVDRAYMTDDWPAKPNFGCRWCGVIDCEDRKR